MPTTNATTAKKAIFALLQAQAAAAAPGTALHGVDVRYAYRGEAGLRCVYGGGWRMDAADATSQAAGLLVAEVVSLSLYIRILARPACDVEETDDDADAVATAIGAVLRANPKLTGAATVAAITSGQGDYSCTDDETISIHAFQVRVSSMVTWG